MDAPSLRREESLLASRAVRSIDLRVVDDGTEERACEAQRDEHGPRPFAAGTRN